MRTVISSMTTEEEEDEEQADHPAEGADSETGHLPPQQQIKLAENRRAESKHKAGALPGRGEADAAQEWQHASHGHGDGVHGSTARATNPDTFEALEGSKSQYGIGVHANAGDNTSKTSAPANGHGLPSVGWAAAASARGADSHLEQGCTEDTGGSRRARHDNVAARPMERRRDESGRPSAYGGYTGADASATSASAGAQEIAATEALVLSQAVSQRTKTAQATRAASGMDEMKAKADSDLGLATPPSAAADSGSQARALEPGGIDGDSTDAQQAAHARFTHGGAYAHGGKSEACSRANAQALPNTYMSSGDRGFGTSARSMYGSVNGQDRSAVASLQAGVCADGCAAEDALGRDESDRHTPMVKQLREELEV
jgi:hypothetical protein